jgi:hypothetical protein
LNDALVFAFDEHDALQIGARAFLESLQEFHLD